MQSTVAQVGLTPFLGHALVGIEFGTGNGNENGVDMVRHGTSIDEVDQNGCVVAFTVGRVPIS